MAFDLDSSNQTSQRAKTKFVRGAWIFHKLSDAPPRTNRLGFINRIINGESGKSLSGFFQQRNGEIALLNHVRRDLDLLDLFVAGQVIHQVEH
jgi:hypothetical protein